MYPDPDDAKTTATTQQPEVFEAIETQDKELEHLSNLIDVLEKRLTPILKIKREDKPRPDERCFESNLAATIATNTCKTTIDINAIQSIIDRLAI